LIADSGGLAMGAGATDDVGDAGGYVVSGGTADASEPNTSGGAADSGEVAFDTIVVSGATELPADAGSENATVQRTASGTTIDGGGTGSVSSGAADFGAQIAAGGVMVSPGIIVSGADVITGGEIGGGGLVSGGGGEPFSARISSASGEFAPVPVWSAAATTDLLADATLTVAGGGAASGTVSAGITNKVPAAGTEFGAADNDDTMNLQSGGVANNTVVGGGDVVGS